MTNQVPDNGNRVKGRQYTRPSLPQEGEAYRPFRLVKYFSMTGFIVIFVFTLGLTVFISSQGKNITQKKSEDFAAFLADNLNHQVFLEYVLPTVLVLKKPIRFGEPEQFNQVDKVIRRVIYSFKVKRVNIYDLKGRILYSTDKELIGTRTIDIEAFENALAGRHSSTLITQKGQSLFGLDKSWTLQTFFPFQAEEVESLGPINQILGVFEIYQDLTQDYTEISKFQYLSIAISLGFSGLIFIILRQIIARGERIIEARNEERRRLEEELHRSHRLAALGQMIAGVAHEIRNPLGIISSTAEILEGKIKSYEPNNRLAEVIVEESRRLNGIVTEFLDFARPQTPRPTTCRMEEILDKNLEFLASAMEKEGIEVARDYHGSDCLDVDPDLLYRVFLNVFMNAMQAMPEGGLITVTTASTNGPNRTRQIEVIIKDSGEGLDEEQAKTVFEPFYTTKNRGTGLGLAIVKNIIEAHNGTVTLEPVQEGGALCRIRLPLSQES